jgi:hypothetical protein
VLPQQLQVFDVAANVIAVVPGVEVTTVDDEPLGEGVGPVVVVLLPPQPAANMVRHISSSVRLFTGVSYDGMEKIMLMPARRGSGLLTNTLTNPSKNRSSHSSYRFARLC